LVENRERDTERERDRRRVKVVVLELFGSLEEEEERRKCVMGGWVHLLENMIYLCF
jgi:hypothetical protein